MCARNNSTVKALAGSAMDLLLCAAAKIKVRQQACHSRERKFITARH
jgi:hypothetical protein